MRRLVLTAVLVSAMTCLAQQRRPAQAAAPAEPPAAQSAEHPEGQARAEGQRPAQPEKEPPEEKPIVTHQESRVGGKVLRYTATTGMMPIKNEQTGKIEAHMFYVAYTIDNPPAGRPLTVCFNGGPGSASVWLHMGAIGPK